MKKINFLVVTLMMLLPFTSCVKDLNTIPLDKEELLSGVVYDNPEAYKQVLAKIYATLALTGQSGPAGNADTWSADEGFSSYLRQYWKAQELTTDEAVNAWTDPGMYEYNTQTWTPTVGPIDMLYRRIYFLIPLCNEFLRESTDEKLTFHNIPAEKQKEIQVFRAEARFMRALAYWHAIDLFGNVPFVLEADGVGKFTPVQKTRAEVFDFVTKELIEISGNDGDLLAPRTNEYGRADKAAAWMLLAKLYLNAGVYTGTEKYTEALEYTEKVIAAGYTLEPNYTHLFLADNDKSKEFIFAILFDGVTSKTWGGTTFIISAASGDNANNTKMGAGAWFGNRTRRNFVEKFADRTGSTDQRALFDSTGHTLDITTATLINNFKEGYAVTKFRNFTSDGKPGKDPTFADTDFPMFRLADAYLMYAEIAARNKGGDKAKAVDYVNQLRQRAYGNASGNITAADLTEQFVLDERARELYWECHRRTDLIRFGKFTGGDYKWQWKGGQKDGVATDKKYNLFPIPASDMGANTNLKQNEGY